MYNLSTKMYNLSTKMYNLSTKMYALSSKMYDLATILKYLHICYWWCPRQIWGIKSTGILWERKILTWRLTSPWYVSRKGREEMPCPRNGIEAEYDVGQIRGAPTNIKPF